MARKDKYKRVVALRAVQVDTCFEGKRNTRVCGWLKADAASLFLVVVVCAVVVRWWVSWVDRSSVLIVLFVAGGLISTKTIAGYSTTSAARFEFHAHLCSSTAVPCGG